MLKDNPKISVLMAVYNTEEEYLREAIDSVLEQTYEDFEFIIVNDGSTNNAEDVIKSYSDDRIKYIYQDNKGAASARNNAWDNATGEYIAIVDSDDVSHIDRFEKQIKYLEIHSDVSLVGSWINILGTKKITKLPYDVRIMDLLADCCIIQPTIMFRKNDFDKYGLRYDEDLLCSEDYDLYSRAVNKLELKNLQEVLVDYRVYKNNTSSKNRYKRIISSFDVQNNLLDCMSTDKKIRERLLDLAYTKKNKTSTLIEKIFSIKNLYRDYSKYKLITVLGLEINIKVRDYIYV